jgi:predicted RNase H-like HicB family nuclease
MNYLVVIEEAKSNFSAYVPDLPGCVVTGETKEETLQRMREAIAMHLDGLREDGLPIPPASTSADYVAV